MTIPKIRLIRTMVVEYTPHPANYPAGMTIEQMAQWDANAKDEDRDIIFDAYKTDEVKWEIIKE